MYANAVPHLETAIQGPIYGIEAKLLETQEVIEAWFRSQWQLTPAPFYTSVDLRNAGFKLAPVDTNLFPAGFNNLSPAVLPLCIHAMQSVLEKNCPTARNILLIPENHTRNQFYLESLASLTEIINKAGYRIKIGSLLSETGTTQTLDLPSGRKLTLHALTREGNKLRIGDFSPCVILLNNDLSSGIPEILQNLTQDILPPLFMGWSSRLKSKHFSHYRDIAQEFAELIQIDPWLIDPLMRNCGKIDFMKREGTECMEHHADTLLTAIQKKYDEYTIDKQPFIFIKADSGTYGMGIMTINSVDQIKQLNRKQRTRMDSTKEGQKVQKVILQEGVYTSERTSENAVAEPVVYMIDHYVVGGFYRLHAQKAYNENLNSPGMQFQPLAFAKSCSCPEKGKAPDAEPNRFYAYGVIARLAMAAAAREAAAPQMSLASFPEKII